MYKCFMENNETFEELCILIGKNIRKLRLEKGLTVKDLSQRTKITQNYIRKIEKGIAYKMLINRHIDNIATALEVKLSELFI